MFKVKNGIAPKILSDIFKLSKSTYNLRNRRDFVSNHMKTVYFGSESIFYQNCESKIMGSFTSGVQNINFTKAVQTSSKKLGSAKLTLSNLQGMHPDCWLFVIQSYFIFMHFICFSFILFNQLICNCCFINLLIYILHSRHELSLHFWVELFFHCNS